MSTPSKLFEPYKLGPITLANRLVMAPLTRNRAVAGLVPNPLAIDYYGQRASAGLLITEASQISQQGQGYQDTPGIYSREQVAGWRKVTDRVHERAAIRLQRGVRDAADMPELEEDVAAARVHEVRDLAPADDLFFRVDAGGVLISLALMRDLACFGDQEARAGTLPVVLDRQRIGYQTFDRAVAGQRRHHEAIGKRDRAKPERLEEFGRRAHF